jgi:hypothetical protein
MGRPIGLANAVPDREENANAAAPLILAVVRNLLLEIDVI